MADAKENVASEESGVSLRPSHQAWGFNSSKKNLTKESDTLSTDINVFSVNAATSSPLPLLQMPAMSDQSLSSRPRKRHPSNHNTYYPPTHGSELKKTVQGCSSSSYTATESRPIPVANTALGDFKFGKGFVSKVSVDSPSSSAWMSDMEAYDLPMAFKSKSNHSQKKNYTDRKNSSYSSPHTSDYGSFHKSSNYNLNNSDQYVSYDNPRLDNFTKTVIKAQALAHSNKHFELRSVHAPCSTKDNNTDVDTVPDTTKRNFVPSGVAASVNTEEAVPAASSNTKICAMVQDGEKASCLPNPETAATETPTSVAETSSEVTDDKTHSGMEQDSSELSCSATPKAQIQQREYFYKLPPVESLLSTDHWQVDRLQQLKTELNEVKASAERGTDIEDWAKHTMQVNPAKNIFKAIKEKVNPELMTQAFLKFYEILQRYPSLAPTTGRLLCSLHLCEAPGAFIVALNQFIKIYRLNITRWEWYGNTLNPYYEGCFASQCIPDDRFILPTLGRWCWGPHGTGDIYHRDYVECLRKLSGSMPGPVQLITADGSMDCQGNPGEQESSTCSLHYCEAVTALHLLGKHGNLVIKKFTFFEDSTVSLLYILCCVFKQVDVYKPITSKLGNSEVYVICLDYIGKDEIKEYLDKFLEAYSSKTPSKSLISESDIPIEFIELIVKCAQYFMDHQVKAINRNVQLFLTDESEDWYSCWYLQEKICDIFKEKNPIRQLHPKQCLLKTRPEWDSNISSAYYKRSKLSGIYKNLDSIAKLKFLSDELGSLTKDFTRHAMDSIEAASEHRLLDVLKIGRGAPFEHISMSRFCFHVFILMYQTFVNLKEQLGMIPKPLFSEPDEVIHIKPHSLSHMTTDSASEVGKILARCNESTRKLVKYLQISIPFNEFIVQSFPNHNHLPTVKSPALDYLYKLISTGSLKDGSTIYLINCPLLSRLQNSLFATLSCSFETVRLVQEIDRTDKKKSIDINPGCHAKTIDALSVPVIMLRKYNPTIGESVAKRFNQIGYTPNTSLVTKETKEAVLESTVSEFVVPSVGTNSQNVETSCSKYSHYDDSIDTIDDCDLTQDSDESLDNINGSIIENLDKDQSTLSHSTNASFNNNSINSCSINNYSRNSCSSVTSSISSLAEAMTAARAYFTGDEAAANAAAEIESFGDVMELLPMKYLLKARTHSIVCRYNILLMIAWLHVVEESVESRTKL